MKSEERKLCLRRTDCLLSNLPGVGQGGLSIASGRHPSLQLVSESLVTVVLGQLPGWRTNPSPYLPKGATEL